MAKLIRFIDNGSTGCWSRIDLESGENCYISVARTGLIIKQSKLGIFGRVVFRVDDVDELAYLAMSLSEVSYDDLTPQEMTNPVLKVITNEIMHYGGLSDIPVMFNSHLDQYKASQGA